MPPFKTSDSNWLDAHRRIDEPELSTLSGMSIAELDELMEYGALVPLAGTERAFSAGVVPALREAARLRVDFDLDLFTVSLLLGYLQRIAQLEHQLRSLHGTVAHPSLPREGPTPWREPHS